MKNTAKSDRQTVCVVFVCLRLTKTFFPPPHTLPCTGAPQSALLKSSGLFSRTCESEGNPAVAFPIHHPGGCVLVV